jgi:hypothetical protein
MLVRSGDRCVGSESDSVDDARLLYVVSACPRVARARHPLMVERRIADHREA